MNILFIGDIVGRPGRKMIKNHLKRLRKELNIDYVIANYENSAHGFSITEKIYKELKNAGIDIFTGGNHTFDKKDVIPLLNQKLLLRPLNYFEAEGDWYYEDENIIVVSAMGIFSMPYGKNPFIELQEFVKDKEKFVFIDFHAEATSEKRALFHLLKGKVGAIIGTHTHIPTDDLEIEEGTCYLTDIGLTGCRDNVIGMEIEAPIKFMLTGRKSKFEVPNNCKMVLNALFMKTEGQKVVEAERIRIKA